MTEILFYLLSGETGSQWMMNRLKDGTKFFYNTDTGDHAWTRGDSIIKDYALLNKEDIQVILFTQYRFFVLMHTNVFVCFV